MVRDELQALFSGEVNGLVAACSTNERPLQGLAGRIDWSFQGALSQFIRNGSITGENGEFVYIPIRKPGRTFHFLLIGIGASEVPGSRTALPKETLEKMKASLEQLGLEGMGVSEVDLPGAHTFAHTFSDQQRWVVL